MKISVITVCFNSEHTIGDTIRSFLSQEYRNSELLIIDGGSQDNTVALAHSFEDPRIRVISEPDNGIYDAMNKGLRLFEGDAVGTLNSDDTYHDSLSLSRVAATLQQADIAYGDLVFVRDHTSKEVVRTWKAGQFSRHSFRLGWMPPHPTFYARRHVVERVGYFDCSYKIAADYDYMLRAMVLYNFRSSYIPHTLVDFKIGGLSASSWRNSIIINREALMARRLHLHSSAIDLATLLRPARRISQVGFANVNRLLRMLRRKGRT